MPVRTLRGRGPAIEHLHGFVDLGIDQAEFGDKGLERRFAHVGMNGSEQRLLIRLKNTFQLPQLFLAEFGIPRLARENEVTLPVDDGANFHDVTPHAARSGDAARRTLPRPEAKMPGFSAVVVTSTCRARGTLPVRFPPIEPFYRSTRVAVDEQASIDLKQAVPGRLSKNQKQSFTGVRKSQLYVSSGLAVATLFSSLPQTCSAEAAPVICGRRLGKLVFEPRLHHV